MPLVDIPHLNPPPAVEQQAFNDPEFVRASEWLARGSDQASVVVVGAPFGKGSISGARCDLAPAAIRRALARFSVWSSDRAISLESVAVRDAGDVDCGEDVLDAQARIESVVRALDAPTTVLLGGDNSVTVGGARGARADALLTLDAHHDCRDPSVRPTNGSPVRQLIEGGLDTVVQVGIHGFSNAEAHARWALDHKVHIVTGGKVRADGMDRTIDGALGLMGRATRIWVDCDMDVLDRAFAPGAPAATAGGLHPADLEEAAYRLGKDPRVVGFDLTEIDPSTDVADTTVRAACAVLLSFLAGVASR
jgi:formiminoglutamase